MRYTPAQNQANERRIRKGMDRLLDGDIPPGGRCDVTTLAREAGVARNSFYANHPYVHLRIEFQQRLEALHQAGTHPDEREGQIVRLKSELAALQQRTATLRTTVTELTEFRTRALSRLAAQHDEITRLRGSADNTSRAPISR